MRLARATTIAATMTAATLAMAAPAQAATYVVLPAPGSMQPPTVLVDRSDKRSQVFVCHSMNEIWAGTCKPQARQ